MNVGFMVLVLASPTQDPIQIRNLLPSASAQLGSASRIRASKVEGISTASRLNYAYQPIQPSLIYVSQASAMRFTPTVDENATAPGLANAARFELALPPATASPVFPAPALRIHAGTLSFGTSSFPASTNLARPSLFQADAFSAIGFLSTYLQPRIPSLKQELGGSEEVAPKPSPKLAKSNTDLTLVDLNLSDADVNVILKSLSEQAGVNLVLGSQVSNKLTLRLKQTPLIDAIRHICTVANLNYLKLDRTYVLASDSQLKTAYPAEYLAAHPGSAQAQGASDEMTTKVVAVNYVSAKEIADTLKAIFTGKDLAVLVGPAPITPTITAMDASATTGVSTSTTSGSASGPASRTLILRGGSKIVQEAMDAIKSIDLPRRQVSILVQISDVANDAGRDIGLNWTFGNVTTTETPSGFNFGKYTRAAQTFDATLKALEDQKLAKVLASPNISLLDGERGMVLIGDKLSYPVVSGYSQSGSPIISKEEKSVGIYLQVAAHIGDDGSITLNLYPQVSAVTGYLSLNGASYPQISTREAQTSLRVKSGETIVVGGLVRDEDIVNFESVPFLSKLPVFGDLFRHRKTSLKKSTVIISITPRLINESR